MEDWKIPNWFCFWLQDGVENDPLFFAIDYLGWVDFSKAVWGHVITECPTNFLFENRVWCGVYKSHIVETYFFRKNVYVWYVLCKTNRIFKTGRSGLDEVRICLTTKVSRFNSSRFLLFSIYSMITNKVTEKNGAHVECQYLTKYYRCFIFVICIS